MNELVQHLRRSMYLRDRAEQTDGQLLEDYLSHHDEAALEALVRRHAPMVWGVCRRLLSSYQDAEDAFQATFLVLVRKAASIASRELLSNWLYGVAHQTALKARATAARRTERERQVKEMPERAVTDQYLWKELQSLLDKELSRLPDNYRAIILLCDLEGKTRKEAARQLGVPEGTVASRLATARTMLAKRLSRHDLTVSGGALAAVLSQNISSAAVPSSVGASTIEALTLATAGQAVAQGAISVKAATLTEGVLKSMLLTKCKTRIAVVGMLSLLLLGFTAYYGQGQQPVKEKTPLAAMPVEEAMVSKEVEEAIKHEPDARYGWLVFGPEKKVRVLVRLTGDELAFDLDGDGKFESKGEVFESEKDCKDIVIAEPDSKKSYVITYVHVAHVVPPTKWVNFQVKTRGAEPSFPEWGLVRMARNPKNAPQAHFYGPLTVTPHGKRIVNRASVLLENNLVDLRGLLPQFILDMAGTGLATDSGLPKSLKRGEETRLIASFNTDGENGCVRVGSPADTDDKKRDIAYAPFPKGVHPFVDVEFPPKEPGGKPIKKRFPLDQFCWDGIYGGHVQVPADAGAGKAKLTFSFDEWKGVKAASTTVEIPVEEPQKGKGQESVP